MLRCYFRGSPTRADHTASGNCNLSAAAAAGGGAIVVDAEDMSYTLKIAGYSRTKALLETGKWATSTPFRVGGHVWTVRYCPNDDADFVSIYLVLDSEGANKHVKVRCKFSVLDKAGVPVPSLSRAYKSVQTFTPKDSTWGYSKFISKADLEGSPHLIDDCFTIRCDVTVLKEIRCEQITKLKRQFVVVPPSNMCRDLGGLLESMDGADVTFHVGGQKFSAHRSVLAARSSVFKAELFGSMMENAGDPVEIGDMESDVFKSLLHFIYTDDSMPQITREDMAMAGHLLVAADRYAVERLKLICEDKLCNHIDSDTVATSLALAEQHSCRGLKEACFEFLASPSNFEAMVASDG
ncbi:BTB/POZ and MATH domain-containing protein 1-like [Triticum aestivum]|nr:BTB/POZ and MATH domain-containing protein 1-like [Triticum aestivum]